MVRHFPDDDRDRPDFDVERDDCVDLRGPLPFDWLDEDLPDLPDDDLLEDDLAEDERLPADDFPDDLPDDLLVDDFEFDDFLLLLEPFFPLPDFLPPPESLFTVAQARRSASFFETPRSS